MRTLWAIQNKETGKICWTRTSKKQAVFNTRKLAREAKARNETPQNTKIVRFVTAPEGASN